MTQTQPSKYSPLVGVQNVQHQQCISEILHKRLTHHSYVVNVLFHDSDDRAGRHCSKEFFSFGEKILKYSMYKISPQTKHRYSFQDHRKSGAKILHCKGCMHKLMSPIYRSMAVAANADFFEFCGWCCEREKDNDNDNATMTMVT